MSKSGNVKSKIANRFLLWFMLVSLLPLALLTTTGYRYHIKSLKNEMMHGLSGVADHKAQNLENFFREKMDDLAVLSHSEKVVDSIEKLISAFQSGGGKGLTSTTLDENTSDFFAQFQESAFSDLLLISPDGYIIFSVLHQSDPGQNLKSGSRKKSNLAKVFLKSSVSLSTEISRYRYYSSTEEYAVFIVAPVLKHGALAGFVATQLSTEIINRLSQDYTGLGKTGETVLGELTGDKIKIIATLRNDPHAAFNIEIPVGSSKAFPLQQAVKGIKGALDSVDYQGKEVLAVWRYIPIMNWGMVVKIDANEALASAYIMRNWSLGTALLTVLFIFFISLFISPEIFNHSACG